MHVKIPKYKPESNHKLFSMVVDISYFNDKDYHEYYELNTSAFYELFDDIENSAYFDHVIKFAPLERAL